MSTIPPVSKPVYNKTKNGYYGELGEGANAHIRFLQTAVTHEELDAITLIENIPGSESWDVRDLFQRDVDRERVTQDILPYLKDKEKVKFFNPLTLMVLPLAPGGDSVENELLYAAPAKSTESGHEYEVYERKGYMRFQRHVQFPAYSTLSWNDQKVKIVAIDGQHRLSALKRWKNDPSSCKDLCNWTIPAVILGIFRAKEDLATASLLEIVRRTFVYINTQAVRVNEARRILLDDENVNAICVQEVVQDSHENDCRPLKDRVLHKLPLLFFDWRGETRHNMRFNAPASVKTIEEIYSWFRHYILGENGGDEQATALGLDDIVPRLGSFGKGSKLSHTDAAQVRGRFLKSVFSGFQVLLTKFTPYQKYIDGCREIERKALYQSDLAIHAFMKLRFGTSRASEDIMEDVNEKWKELIGEFEVLKNSCLDELLELDVGMRGVMCAFGCGKRYFDDSIGYTAEWLEYGQWFVDQLNKVYSSGWFRSRPSLDGSMREALQHVVYDAAGNIVNYRLEKQDSAFGALLAILIFAYGAVGDGVARFSEVWDEYSESMRTTLRAGYRRHFKAIMQDNFKGTHEQFKAEANKRASEAAQKHLDDLDSLARSIFEC